MPDGHWRGRALAAEKTAGMLKEQVRSLYDRGPQTTIHRQLRAASEREEQNRQKRAVLEARNEALQRHSEELEAKVEERTRALRVIFDNVAAGFLIVDGSGRIQDGFTRSCVSLLGQEIEAGMEFPSLVCSDVTEQVNLAMGLEQLFFDFLPEEVALGQLPSRFHVQGRLLKTEGRVVRDDQGDVVGVLFTITDETALEIAREEARVNAMLLRVLRQKDAFLRFLEDTNARVESCKESVSDQAFVRRGVHTIKGNAASFDLESIAAAAHRAEEGATIEVSDLEDIEAAVTAFLHRHGPVLGVDRGRRVEVPMEELDELRRLLHPVDAPGLAEWGAHIVQQPASDLLGPVGPYVERLAERLGKQVDFALIGGETLVDPRPLQPVLANLNHVIRNAVDHGIEPPEERGDKPERGAVRLRVERLEDHWVLEVADDGRGLDLAGLRERARALNVDAGDGSFHDLSLVAFVDGLSTRQEVTETSGRGVGLGAFRAAVQGIGGRVRLESTPGAGTSVQVLVPVPQS